MMKPIRVLMVITNLRVSNGVASFAMNYFRRLSENVQMDFALLSDIPSPYYDEIKAKGGKIHILPPLAKPAEHFRFCNRIFREEKYDIIHNNLSLKALPIMGVAKANGVPTRIMHGHSSRFSENAVKDRINRILLPLMLNMATDYAACSKAAALTWFKKKKYIIIPNVVSGKRLHYSEEKRAEIREKMNAEEKLIIGSVGRVAAEKNPVFAIGVIADLVKQCPNIEYWWIGSGPMDQTLKEETKRQHCEDHIRILGSRDDVPDLYQAMDLFFLPSLFEGLPVTGVEAQAMGLPCVISDSVTKELVYTDLVKYVSLDAPREEWIETLKGQLKRVPERRSYAAELRGSVFSEEQAGDNLEKIYQRMMRKNTER